jgi:hypothetical protein
MQGISLKELKERLNACLPDEYFEQDDAVIILVKAGDDMICRASGTNGAAIELVMNVMYAQSDLRRVFTESVETLKTIVKDEV